MDRTKKQTRWAVVYILAVAIAAAAYVVRAQTVDVTIRAAQTTLTLLLKGDQYYLVQPSNPRENLPVTLHVVVLPDDGPPPPPGPGPGPELSERGKAIRDAAAKVTDATRRETATKLADVYAGTAAKVRGGALTGESAIMAAAKTGADGVLGAKAAAWQPVRLLLTEQWADVARAGGDDAEYAKLLDEVAAGLRAM